MTSASFYVSFPREFPFMPNRFTSQHVLFVLSAVPILLAAPNAFALTFVGDRLGFEASFTSNASSSIVDSDGAFAADPAVGSGLEFVSRTGLVDGEALSYRIYDVDFSNTPDGTIAPGSAVGDIFELDKLNVESPVGQGKAKGSGTWGIDSSTGANSTRNAAVFEFDRPVGHFGLDLHDFESSAIGRFGELRVYNDGALLSGLTQEIKWGDGNEDGNDVSYFIGFVAEDSNQFFDTIAFVLGDDDDGGTGVTERWAADNFTFGEASAISNTAAATTAVPTPALLPGLIGFGASLIRKKRQAK